MAAILEQKINRAETEALAAEHIQEIVDEFKRENPMVAALPVARESLDAIPGDVKTELDKLFEGRDEITVGEGLAVINAKVREKNENALGKLLGVNLAERNVTQEQLDRVKAEVGTSPADGQDLENVQDGPEAPAAAGASESGDAGGGAAEAQSVSKGFGGILGKIFDALGIDPAFAAVLVTAITAILGVKENDVSTEQEKTREEAIAKENAEKEAAAQRAKEEQLAREAAEKKQAEELAAQQKAEREAAEARAKEEAAKALEVAATAVGVGAAAKLTSEHGLIPNDRPMMETVEEHDPNQELAERNKQEQQVALAAVGVAAISGLGAVVDRLGSLAKRAGETFGIEDLGNSMKFLADRDGSRVTGPEGMRTTPAVAGIGGRGEGAAIGAGD